MNKKAIICLSKIFICMVTAVLVNSNTKTSTKKTSSMNATILTIEDDYVRVADNNNAIYTFYNSSNSSVNVGDAAVITYTGKLNKDKEKKK